MENGLSSVLHRHRESDINSDINPPHDSCLNFVFHAVLLTANRLYYSNSVYAHFDMLAVDMRMHARHPNLICVPLLNCCKVPPCVHTWTALLCHTMCMCPRRPYHIMPYHTRYFLPEELWLEILSFLCSGDFKMESKFVLRCDRVTLSLSLSLSLSH